jgi:VWFA-related protein
MTLPRCWLIPLGLMPLVCAGVLRGQSGVRDPRGAAAPRQKLPATAAAKKKKGEPAPPPKPLLVDAVAWGADGKPVRDLTAGDFTVSVLGETRKVTGVAYVDTAAGKVSGTLPVKLERPHRTMVLVADDLGLSAAGSEKVRGVLSQFIETRMTASDEAAIVRTSAGQGAMQKLTADRAALRSALDDITYSPAPGLDQVVHAAGARETLRQIFTGLRDLPGRKAVILFSENPNLFESKVMSSLIDAAQGAAAVCSAIDMRGATAGIMDSGLAALVTQTGGRPARQTDDPAAALAGALEDEQGYYVIGFEGGEGAGDLFTGRPLPQHPVTGVTRAGVQVRGRQGLAGGGDFLTDTAGRQVWRPMFTTPAADIVRGFTSPFASGAIPLRFVAVYSTGKAGPGVDGRVFIDAKDLTFTRKVDGQITASFDIEMAAFDESGVSLQSDGNTYALTLNPATFQEAVQRGFVAAPHLSLRSAGAFQVRVSVRDGTSGRIGSASQFIHAMDLTNGQVSIPGIVLSPEDATLRSLLNRFGTGQDFRYSYQVVNLTVDESKHSAIDVVTLILRNGETIYQGKPSQVTFSEGDNPKLRAAVGTVRLGTLEPGHYILQLMVKDRLAKDARSATQYVNFEVVPAE